MNEKLRSGMTGEMCRICGNYPSESGKDTCGFCLDLMMDIQAELQVSEMVNALMDGEKVHVGVRVM